VAVRADFESPTAVFHTQVLTGIGRFAGATGAVTAEVIGDGSKVLVTVD
jgi:hypothetical protein